MKKNALNQANIDSWKFCSKDETKPTINYVMVDENFTYATNGKHLIKVEKTSVDLEDYPKLNNQPADKGYIHYQELKKLKIKKNKSMPQLENAVLTSDNETVYLEHHDLTSTSTLRGIKENNFPAAERILQPIKEKLSKERLRIRLNPNMLLDILQYASKYAKKEYNWAGIDIYIHKEDPSEKVIYIEFKTQQDQKVEYLIMPMKITD